VLIYLKAILLGIVEGATEFLPVSSTGHLILVERFLELSTDPVFNNAFMVLIQFPAILSVVIYFWEDISPFTDDLERKQQRIMLWKKVIIAIIPVIILGGLFADAIDKLLFAPLPVAVALIGGGLVLIIMEKILNPQKVNNLNDITAPTALAIGLFQCLAMIPGTSRSGATIFGAMVMGVDRKTAAAFSFILAIPTMAAATVYKFLQNGLSFTGEQWVVLAIGGITSFAMAYASIYLLMSYIQKRSFAAFGWYRVILGTLLLIAISAGVFT
jgi:undecaprenyl-diphosphatase